MRVAGAGAFRISRRAAMDPRRRFDVTHVLAASRLSRGHLYLMAVAAATTIACAALVAV
jgi:hypothetical protein